MKSTLSKQINKSKLQNLANLGGWASTEDLMAFLRGLSTPRALKVNKKLKKYFGHEINIFLSDLHHILHARNCIHFLLFPHIPGPSRPLKQAQDFNLPFCIFSTFTFLVYFLGGIWAMVTRPVQGRWSYCGVFKKVSTWARWRPWRCRPWSCRSCSSAK